MTEWILILRVEVIFRSHKVSDILIAITMSFSTISVQISFVMHLTLSGNCTNPNKALQYEPGSHFAHSLDLTWEKGETVE